MSLIGFYRFANSFCILFLLSQSPCRKSIPLPDCPAKLIGVGNLLTAKLSGHKVGLAAFLSMITDIIGEEEQFQYHEYNEELYGNDEP
jgi:hypothetical protein